MKFKVGDIVVGNESATVRYGFTVEGWEGKVTHIYSKNRFEAEALPNSHSGIYDLEAECFDLKKSSKKSMNIIEKFKAALLQEPEKSFRSKGITNGDGMLTEDGKTLFLQFLLEKNKEEFKKEVVDRIEEDKE